MIAQAGISYKELGTKLRPMLLLVSFSILISISYFLFPAPKAHASGLIKPANSLGLVGYWSFEDGRGTTATDFSGKGNTGTLEAYDQATEPPTWASGKIGSGLFIDGQDNYDSSVTLAGLALTNTNTISFWVNFNSYYGSYHGLVNESTNLGIFFKTASKKITFYNGGDNLANTELGLNRWYHVAVVNNAGSVTFYLDGVADGSANALPGLTINFLGNSGSDEPLDGTLDEVRIYNRALTAPEVLSLYNNSKLTRSNSSRNYLGVTNGLVGHWPFDGADLSGTTAFNRSGVGNNGTLTSGPTVTIGKLGQGLNFDGADDYVNVTSYTQVQNLWDGGGSIAFWAKPRSSGEGANGFFMTQAAIQTILANGEDATNVGIQFDIDWSGGTARWRDSGGGTFPMKKNEWGHVVITYNADSTANNPTFYYNGVSYGSLSEIVSPSGTRSASTGDWQIGSNTAGSRAAATAMDDVRFYNRELSVSEVMQLYRMGNAGINRSNVGAPGTSNLVLWHTFDGSKLNTTTSTDSINTAYNGTLVGAPTPTIGKIGQAIRFNGVANNYVSIPQNVVSNDTLSISLWAKFNVVNSMQGIFAIFTGASDAMEIWVDNSSNRLWGGDFDHQAFSGNDSISIGPWHHIVLVSDGAATTFYVNGAVSGSPGTTNFSTFTYGTIGGRGENFPFNGSVDDVRIYNRALSAAEVLNLYNAGR